MTTRQVREITSIWERMKFHTFSLHRKHCLKISGKMWTTGGFSMRTVKLGISSREKTNKRLLGALEGKPQGTFISFESPALLFKVLSGNRWELLKVMTDAGPMSQYVKQHVVWAET